MRRLMPALLPAERTMAAADPKKAVTLSLSVQPAPVLSLVAGDHNPFCPQAQAHALWAAAQALTPSLGVQVSFVHHASTPFAQVLRKG